MIRLSLMKLVFDVCLMCGCMCGDVFGVCVMLFCWCVGIMIVC